MLKKHPKAERDGARVLPISKQLLLIRTPAPHHRANGKYTLLAYWHLCSLDAPTVAALWTWFIARAFGVSIPWTEPVCMFLAVWMLYAADRLLDAHPQGAGWGKLEMRHTFHEKHKRVFLVAMAACSLVLALLLPQFTHVDLRLFSALGSLLFAYFFLIHIWPLSLSGVVSRAGRLPKEFAVGAFFSAAIFIPTATRVPNLRAPLLGSIGFFAITCTLNCLYVHVWEHAGSDAESHWATRSAARHIVTLTVVSLACSVLVAAINGWSSGIALSASACGLSLMLFLLLHRMRTKLTVLTLRSVVDLALLTPVVIAIVTSS